MDAPDLLSLSSDQIKSLSRPDQLVYQFVRQHRLLQPKQLALALKVQRQSCGPLEMILLQLGFIGMQDLARFWEFRSSS